MEVRNERGDKLVEWCESWDQVIMNTYFRHHCRYLYTWRSPGDRYRNQIDYITINKRFRNSIMQIKTYPGADCGVGCDHVPLVAIMKVKMKKLRVIRKRRKDWNILRRDQGLRDEYRATVTDNFGRNEEVVESIDAQWKHLQDALVTPAEEIVPNTESGRRQPWMDQKILTMMEDRRKARNFS